MILNFLIRLVQMLALTALQVLVLNHIHLWGMGTPLITVMFLGYMRLGSKRVSTMLWAFSIGLLTDIFSNTPGVGCGAMTFVGLIQPPLLKLMVPRDCVEDLLPSYTSMGKWNHIRYMLLLLLLYHVVYFALESFSYFHLEQVAVSMGISYVASAIIVLALESLYIGKSKKE